MKLAMIALVLVATSTASAFQIFENAVRRDKKSSRETRPVVKLFIEKSPGKFSWCTGFFVENKSKRALIATARHCAAYQLGRMCNEKKISVVTEFGKQEGTCKEVVVASEEHDMAIIEMDFANWSALSQEVDFLNLSSQRPRVGTKLKMIGYPADTVRNGEFTVTENCWIHDGRMVEITDYSQVDQASNQKIRAAQVAATPTVEAQLASKIKYDRVAFHNCSVYGGNSGGPILIHGTPVVLGLPTTYVPGPLTKISAKLSSSMDSTATFIETNKAALDRAGIVYVRPYKSGNYISPYQWFKSKGGAFRCYRTTDPAGSQPAPNEFCEDTANRIAR